MSCMVNSVSPMKIVVQGFLHGLGKSDRVFPTFGHGWTRRVAGKLDESTGDFMTSQVQEGLDESANCTR